MMETEKSLDTALYENYGIQLDEVAIAENELVKRGFYKLPPEALAGMSAAVSFAPDVLFNAIRQKYTKTLVENAVKGTYRIIIPKVLDGTYNADALCLTESKLIKGGFTTQVRTKDENHLVDLAVLDPNKAPELLFPRAVDIAQGLFHLASFTLGQYFMLQINGKLLEIKNSLQDVMHFLENEKMSALEAAYDELQELYDHIEFIRKSEARSNSSIERLRQTIFLARKDMHFFQRQILEIKAKASAGDKRDEVSGRVRDIIQAIMRYRLALAIFCEAKLMETYLARINDTDELSVFCNEIECATEHFIEDYRSARDWSNKYLVDHRMIGSSNSMTFVDSIDGYLRKDEGDEKTSKPFVGMTKQMLKPFREEPDDLYLPVKSMKNYISILQNKPEFYLNADGVYTNIPIEG